MKSEFKKLGEKGLKELYLIKEKCFNIEDGNLNPDNYELFSSKIQELKQDEYDVSEFESFLKKYETLYQLKKNPFKEEDLKKFRSIRGEKIKIKLNDLVQSGINAVSSLDYNHKGILLYSKKDKQYLSLLNKLRDKGIRVIHISELSEKEKESQYFSIDLEMIEVI